jgi:dipeptidyl aminopeptidase/acylaminoacyl peptidase
VIRAQLLSVAILGLVYMGIHASAQDVYLSHLGGPSTVGQQLRRPVTVTDMIEMTQPGQPRFQGGMVNKHEIATFSPDGKSFLILLKHGVVKSNTNQYWIEQLSTRGAVRGNHGRTLVRFSSSSNRAAISQIEWLDSNTISFLAERPGEAQQLYTLDTNTRKLTKLTNSAMSLAGYAIGPKRRQIAFITEEPLETQPQATDGMLGTVVQTQPLLDLLLGADTFGHRFLRNLYIQDRRGSGAIEVNTEDKIIIGSPLYLSPDGHYLIVRTMVSGIPPQEWREYQDDALQMQLRQTNRVGQRQIIYRLQLVDLISKRSRPLLTSPIPPGEYPDVVWSPDSKTVVLSGILLPLDQSNNVDQNVRRRQLVVAELSIENGHLTPITTDAVRLNKWDAGSDVIHGITGTWSGADALAEGQPIAYKKLSSRWQQVRSVVRHGEADHGIEVTLEEDMNSAPKILARDLQTGRSTLLQDLNPGFSKLQFGEVRDLGVLTCGDVRVRAGVYLPVNYKPGVQYPLVIQTHEWTPERFWIDGPFNSAFAAQALAGKGMIVAQIALNRTHMSSPREVEDEAKGYEAVIEHLHKQGMIDVNRMGIIGFSRSVLGVKYAMIHSRFHFAAATLADGSDVGYFRYIADVNSTPWQTGDAEGINGGIPVKDGLQSWFDNAMDLDLSQVSTPIRFEAYNPESLFFSWEPFGLRARQGRPVDFIYLPTGEHVLVKPQDRMASQQGNVDWFSFWLQGNEDTDPAKRDRYKHWEDLRQSSASDIRSAAQTQAGSSKPD